MTFRFPLPGTKEDWVVTQEYQRVDQGGKENHYGIDWSAYKKGATLKAPIYAAADGVVCKASFGDDYGNGTKTTSAGYIVEINHGKDADGYYYGTRYQHMNAATILKVGASVKKGEIIGYVGSSGASTGAHLHFEILKYNTPITGFSGQRGNVNPRNYIYNAQPTPTPAPSAVKTYELYVAVPTYNNAANAKNRVSANKITYGPGIFYIYTKYPDGVDGMFNITDNPTGNSAGAWINPADNVKPTPKPVRKYKVGDTVSFKYIFEKSTTTTKLTPAITQGKITRVLEEDVPNPYLIEDGAIGWTNEASITGLVTVKVETKPKEEPKQEEVKVEEKPVVKEEPKVEEKPVIKEEPKEEIQPEVKEETEQEQKPIEPDKQDPIPEIKEDKAEEDSKEETKTEEDKEVLVEDDTKKDESSDVKDKPNVDNNHHTNIQDDKLETEDVDDNVDVLDDTKVGIVQKILKYIIDILLKIFNK